MPNTQNPVTQCFTCRIYVANADYNYTLDCCNSCAARKQQAEQQALSDQQEANKPVCTKCNLYVDRNCFNAHCPNKTK